MANEEKLGLNDVHMKRIEGETVDGQPAYAMAVYNAYAAEQNQGGLGGLISGHRTVGVPGTQVPIVTGSTHANSPVAVKALELNSGTVYIGNSTVSNLDGFELNAGDVLIFNYVHDLFDVFVDATYSGSGVSWITLNTNM